MDPKNKTGVGFYMDRDQHQKIRKWCEATGIDFYIFCRVAISHLFFFLTIMPGESPRDVLAYLKELKPLKTNKGEKNHGRHQRKNRRI